MQKTALKSILRKSILLAMFPIQALALGLGDIEITSRLNQPLDAKVKLLSVNESDAKDLIVSLASSAAFIRAGIDRPFFLTKLRFKVVGYSDGSQVIEVTSRRPVVEPFLNFLVEVDWPKGRLLREYTILLDPPIVVSTVTNNQEAVEPEIDRFSTPAYVQPKPIAKPLIKPTAKVRPKPKPTAPSRFDEGNNQTPSRFDNNDKQNTDEQIEDAGFINRSETAASNKRKPLAPKIKTIQKASKNNLFYEPEKTSFSEGLLGDAINTNQIPKRKAGLPRVSEDLDENITAFKSIERKPKSITVNKNNTLWRLAKNNKPKGTTVHQMMLALLRYNPEAFVKGNVNRMRSGVVLRVPDKESVVSIDQATAVSIVKEQNALYQQYFAKIQGLTPVGIVKKVAKPAVSNKDSNQVFAKTKAELEILKAENNESTSPEKSGEDAVKSTGNIKKEILLAEEELLSEQQNQNDLRSEMDELLAINSKMDRLIDLKINQLSQLQNRLSSTSEEDALAQTAVDSEETVADEAIVEETIAEETVEEETIAEETVAEETIAEETVAEETVAEEVITPTKLPTLNITKQKSMFERLLTITNIASLAAILALIGGAVFYIRRKKGDDLETSDDVIEKMDETAIVNTEHDETMLVDTKEKEELDAALSDLMDEGVDDETDFDTTNFDSSDIDEFDDKEDLDEDEDLDSDEKDDVIAEADVYLAYGLYPQAEDLLNAALENHPKRVSYIEKLLETQYAAKNVEGFQTKAEEFKKIAKVDGSPAWLRVVAMGQVLCPTYALFSQERNVAVDISDVASAKPVSPDLDLDDGATNIDLDFGDEKNENELDFDINADDETAIEANNDAFSETQVTSAAEKIDMNATMVMLNSTDDALEEETMMIDSNDLGLDEDLNSEPKSVNSDELISSDPDDMSLDFDVDAFETNEKQQEPIDELDFGDENSLEFDLGSFDDEMQIEEDNVNSDKLVLGEAEQKETDKLQAKIDDDLDTDIFTEDLELDESDDSSKKESKKHLSTNDTATNNSEIDALLDDDLDLNMDADNLDSLDENIDDGMETIMELAPETIDLDDMVDDTDTNVATLDSTPFNLTDLDELMAEQEQQEDAFTETLISSSDSLEAVKGNVSDELDTMIELAIAYIDMGDSESAVSALEEIIETGNEEQKIKAKDLLSKVK